MFRLKNRLWHTQIVQESFIAKDYQAIIYATKYFTQTV